MDKIKKRQAMCISINDIKEVEKRIRGTMSNSREYVAPSDDQKVIISIINKSDCSDTWEFE